MNRLSLVSISLFCILINAFGQMPHEVLVIANQSSEDSLEVANYFIDKRQIPKNNLIKVEIPESIYGGRASCDPSVFEKLIWNPVQEEINKRNISHQIKAWIYSTDFPIRILSDEYDRRQISICGHTFLRNKGIGKSLIEDGKYHSPIFAGPNNRFRLLFPSCSLSVLKSGLGSKVSEEKVLDRLRVGLGSSMPLPSMMLGYTGEGGNTIDTVLSVLERGKLSDHNGLRSGFYFVTNNNIRSTCRAWQFSSAQESLHKRNITSVITNEFPKHSALVMGVLCGAKKVSPKDIGSYAPGAVAEHLTSWSAEFQRPQTKCTEWLEAGVTATSGSVVEPYANSDKFPSARFFEHYTAGCSVLESFYQSVACPLQQLFIGDPLARPYSPEVKVRLLGANKLIDQPFRYEVSASSKIKGVKWLYTFLLNGKEVLKDSHQNFYKVDPSILSDGYHTLQSIAMVDHAVRFYGSDIKEFFVNRLGRSLQLSSEVIELSSQVYGFKIKVNGLENPEFVRLIAGSEVLDEQIYSADLLLKFDESRVGNGICNLQVIGIYDDGMEVASQPLIIKVFD